MPERMPDVIVLLPGILGSALQKDGRDVWALSGGAAIRTLFSLGGAVRDLALTEDPPDADDLGDGVTAGRLLPDVHLIPYLWKIDGYSRVRNAIKSVFDVVEGKNYFEFPYDWRRDNRVAARRLARESEGWLRSWRASSGNAEARLILIAHSMGGVVSRYFLDVLGGWRGTRALITFGTPYRGSLNAVDSLANGIRKGPFGLVDLSTLVRSLTSVYQLLPIYPCFDSGAALVRVAEAAGIPNLDRAKAAAALAFHDEIHAAVEANRRETDYLERGYKVHPIVGIEQPTFQSAGLAGDGVELITSYKGEDQRGDGTVPRVSAMPREMQDATAAMFAATAHASLQNAEAVLAHLTGLILSFYLDLGPFRAPEPSTVRVGVDVDDLYLDDEQITIDVLPNAGPVDLRASVVEVDSGAEVAARPLHIAGPVRERVTIPPLPAGVYRVSVRGGPTVGPVDDVFTVVNRRAASGG